MCHDARPIAKGGAAAAAAFARCAAASHAWARTRRFAKAVAVGTRKHRRMAVVKCVTMQRDETLLLDAWFQYYGHLFGYENLAVIDNGSTEPSVIATLARFERAGCWILRGLDSVLDFHAKGAHMRNVITHWDGLSAYDFALPVDVDEFLTLFTPDGLTCRRDAIHAHLDSLIGTEQALGFDLSFFNAPRHPGCFKVQHYPKSFLAARSIAELDHGLHAARSRLADGTRRTDFTYLHFHNKPFATLLQQARRKLELFVDVENRDVLRTFEGPGNHLVRYFFMTEGEYLAQHDDTPLVRFPQFGRLMAALGITDTLFGGPSDDLDLAADPDFVGFVPPGGDLAGTMPFSPRRYLERHPGLADPHWHPIRHYAMHGHREGRTAPARGV